MDYSKIREEYKLSKQVNMEKWVKCKEYLEKNYPDKRIKIEDIKSYARENNYSTAESCANRLGYDVIYICDLCKKELILKKGKGVGRNYTLFRKGYIHAECHTKWLEEWDKQQKIEEQNRQRKRILKEKEKRKDRASYGIYGIYIENELVYVGKTIRDFKERWVEHERLVKDEKIPNSNQPYLYSAMRSGEYEFRKLIEFTDDIIFDIELQYMEFALIEVHKPKYNYVGVKVPYEFKGY